MPKIIYVVQYYDAFSQRNHFVVAVDSHKEAKAVVKQQKQEDNDNDIRGISYGIRPCSYRGKLK